MISYTRQQSDPMSMDLGMDLPHTRNMKHALDETTQNRVDRLWEYSKNLEEVPLCRSVGHKSECLCYVEEHLHKRFGYLAS